MLEKYNWTKNPFDPNLPDPAFLVYQTQTEELIRKIRENRLLWLNAPMGAGKTTILKYILQQARKNKMKILYWHYGSNPSLDAFKVATRTLYPSFFDRFCLKTRAVLIDEANYVNDREFFRYLVGLLDNEKIHPSLIFASVAGPPTDIMFETFKDRPIEIVNINSADPKDVLSMVARRIKSVGGKGLVEPFTPEVVKNLIRESKTPRILLEKLMAHATGEQFVPAPVSAPTPFPPGPPPEIIGLSEQQKEIVRLLSQSPMSVKDIAEELGTTQAGVRSQLNRLISIEFLRAKGCRMPIAEKIGDRWQLHKEFRVAAPTIAETVPMVSVPSHLVRAVKTPSPAYVPPPSEPASGPESEWKFVPSPEIDDVIRAVLSQKNAVEGKNAVPVVELIAEVCTRTDRSESDVRARLDKLRNYGRIVILDDNKAFLV